MRAASYYEILQNFNNQAVRLATLEIRKQSGSSGVDELNEMVLCSKKDGTSNKMNTRYNN